MYLHSQVCGSGLLGTCCTSRHVVGIHRQEEEKAAKSFISQSFAFLIRKKGPPQYSSVNFINPNQIFTLSNVVARSHIQLLTCNTSEVKFKFLTCIGHISRAQQLHTANGYYTRQHKYRIRPSLKKVLPGISQTIGMKPFLFYINHDAAPGVGVRS